MTSYNFSLMLKRMTCNLRVMSSNPAQIFPIFIYLVPFCLFIQPERIVGDIRPLPLRVVGSNIATCTIIFLFIVLMSFIQPEMVVCQIPTPSEGRVFEPRQDTFFF